MSLAPLASESDVVARLGRDLTGGESGRIEKLLIDASASARAACRQEITRSETTVRLRTRRGVSLRTGRSETTFDDWWGCDDVRHVLLAQRPVNSITTVEDLDGNDVTSWWDGLQRLEVATCSIAVVTYDHGLDEAPDLAVAVVCQAVMRALGVKPDQTGTQQESIAGYSQTLGSAAAAGGIGLLPAERSALQDLYPRRRAGTIALT